MAMSGTRKTILIIGGIFAVVVLVAILGIAILVAAFRKSEPVIADNSLLALRISGSLLTTARTILSRNILVDQTSLSPD